ALTVPLEAFVMCVLIYCI
ncbi:DUF1196 domain-containing protein, partial [Vibrio cholerae]|nr:DUF1196 domain-containing protein [Vibrio cholerae]